MVYIIRPIIIHIMQAIGQFIIQNKDVIYNQNTGTDMQGKTVATTL